MRALVTGAEGFVGPHLIDYLEKLGIETYGTYLHTVTIKKNFLHMDVTDKKEVYNIIKKIRPDYLFHLAGFSSVKKSFETPELCRKINTEGTRNILDAILENGLNTRMLLVSSVEVYGKPQSVPITEDHQLNPQTPYGESKLMQELICKEYVKKHGIFVVISRSFNQTGPGQTDSFVIPSFAKQIALIEKGQQDSIKVGNIEVIRDFSDVRDVIRAYYKLLEKGKKGEIYHVCSGKGYKIKELLSGLVSLSTKDIRIDEDPDKLRNIDLVNIIGDNTKLIQAIGWRPEIPMEKTLGDVLEYWRKNTQ
jgi:GDP-4-dehydro-6-deoxy-D-mannose reductase